MCVVGTQHGFIILVSLVSVTNYGCTRLGLRDERTHVKANGNYTVAIGEGCSLPAQSTHVTRCLIVSSLLMSSGYVTDKPRYLKGSVATSVLP